MATGVYGDPMSWFQIGAQTAPMAGLGNAIRGILDLHTKYGELAAGKAFEAAMPKEQAMAKYYSSPMWQGGGLPEGYEMGFDAHGRQILKASPRATESEQKTALWNQLKSQVEAGDITRSQMEAQFQKAYPFSSVASEMEAVVEPRKVNIFGTLFGPPGIKGQYGKPIIGGVAKGYTPSGPTLATQQFQATTAPVTGGVQGDEYAQALQILISKGYSEQEARQMLGR